MTTTFDVDEATLKSISELKSTYRVKTNAQVIRKALALARVAAQHCEKIGEHYVLRIRDGQGQEKSILLNE